MGGFLEHLHEDDVGSRVAGPGCGRGVRAGLGPQADLRPGAPSPALRRASSGRRLGKVAQQRRRAAGPE